MDSVGRLALDQSAESITTEPNPGDLFMLLCRYFEFDAPRALDLWDRSRRLKAGLELGVFHFLPDQEGEQGTAAMAYLNGAQVEALGLALFYVANAPQLMTSPERIRIGGLDAAAFIASQSKSAEEMASLAAVAVLNHRGTPAEVVFRGMVTETVAAHGSLTIYLFAVPPQESATGTREPRFTSYVAAVACNSDHKTEALAILSGFGGDRWSGLSLLNPLMDRVDPSEMPAGYMPMIPPAQQ